MLKKKGINENDVIKCEIVKKSIDARDKKDVHYAYSFNVQVKNEKKYRKLKKVDEPKIIGVEKNRNSEYRPIIVGAGPAGLFCALTLIEYGYKPIIIERGKAVEQRKQDVDKYRKTGVLDTASNVQFGEGGAGAFSDGKLTTGVNSPYIKKVLNWFYQFGAPKEITYYSHPHIGTDNLMKVLVNIRNYIEEKGGTYYFNTKFVDFSIVDELIEVNCNDKQFITDALVLAIGHSARDTFEMLYNKEMNMKRKVFSIGVRIEHLQEMINKAQYGEYTDLQLPSAEYKLVYHGSERTCYSFCMCPGGEVIASSSEQGAIVTNGMSNFARDGKNANAALLVNINPNDLPGDNPLEGIYYQKDLEEKAYKLAGSNGFAPVQLFEDYKNNEVTTKLGKVVPSYKPGYTFANLNELFPDFVNETLKEGIDYFDTKIKGFGDGDSVLTAVESRTSSPITIVRDEQLMSNIKGIYPCGEGAGYAGGITTAAIDGIKVAIQIIEDIKS